MGSLLFTVYRACRTHPSEHSVECLVPTTRLELVRPFGHWVLNPACLPFHQTGNAGLFNVSVVYRYTIKMLFVYGLRGGRSFAIVCLVGEPTLLDAILYVSICAALILRFSTRL